VPSSIFRGIRAQLMGREFGFPDPDNARVRGPG
jgi:hypothetical protein